MQQIHFISPIVYVILKYEESYNLTGSKHFANNSKIRFFQHMKQFLHNHKGNFVASCNTEKDTSTD